MTVREIRRRVRAPWFVAITAGVAAACSAFGSSHDDGPPPVVSDTGAPPDAGPVGAPDATSEATSDATSEAEAGPVVLWEDHFETGASVCDGWDVNSASAERVAGAGVGGSTACRLCGTLPGGGSMKKTTPGASTRGNYTPVAHVQKDPSSNETLWDAVLATYADLDAAPANESSNSGTLAATWQVAQVAVNGADPASDVAARLVTDDTAGDCYLVDDVVLVFTPSP